MSERLSAIASVVCQYSGCVCIGISGLGLALQPPMHARLANGQRGIVIREEGRHQAHVLNLPADSTEAEIEPHSFAAKRQRLLRLFMYSTASTMEGECCDSARATHWHLRDGAAEVFPCGSS
jgi:hypothetical protein